jgi:glutamyl-tRNA(Gln) amidotransferase subunit D
MALIKTNPGDKITITLNDGHQEIGIVMPSSKPQIIIIKLSTGYNVGFERKNIKDLKILKKVKAGTENPKESKFQKNKNLPTISILHTGGTIASKVDYRTGGVVSSFTPEDLLNLFPEIKDIANIESELLAQMWSDDLRIIHFQKIVRAIEKKIKQGSNGIIVGSGTDNLAVAAAAVAFMVEKTPVPIIFIGSQRSSDRGSSDAAMNLICAAKFITKTNFADVAICMHASANDDYCNILSATKTYKLHSSRRDAFQSINSQPIAKVFYKQDKIEFTDQDLNFSKRNQDPADIKTAMEDKVALIKIHTNMYHQQFKSFRNFRGLIIEGTGLGHLPIHSPTKGCEEHQKIKATIQELIDSGTIVVMTTQCLFGSTNMNVYSKGRDQIAMGIINGKDMLATTAQVKLAWLLANESDKERVKELMQINLRGEINEKIKYQKDFTI